MDRPSPRRGPDRPPSAPLFRCPERQNIPAIGSQNIDNLHPISGFAADTSSNVTAIPPARCHRLRTSGRPAMGQAALSRKRCAPYCTFLGAGKDRDISSACDGRKTRCGRAHRVASTASCLLRCGSSLVVLSPRPPGLSMLAKNCVARLVAHQTMTPDRMALPSGYPADMARPRPFVGTKNASYSRLCCQLDSWHARLFIACSIFVCFFVTRQAGVLSLIRKFAWRHQNGQDGRVSDVGSGVMEADGFESKNLEGHRQRTDRVGLVLRIFGRCERDRPSMRVRASVSFGKRLSKSAVSSMVRSIKGLRLHRSINGAQTASHVTVLRRDGSQTAYEVAAGRRMRAARHGYQAFRILSWYERRRIHPAQCCSGTDPGPRHGDPRLEPGAVSPTGSTRLRGNSAS